MKVEQILASLPMYYNFEDKYIKEVYGCAFKIKESIDEVTLSIIKRFINQGSDKYLNYSAFIQGYEDLDLMKFKFSTIEYHNDKYLVLSINNLPANIIDSIDLFKDGLVKLKETLTSRKIFYQKELLKKYQQEVLEKIVDYSNPYKVSATLSNYNLLNNKLKQRDFDEKYLINRVNSLTCEELVKTYEQILNNLTFVFYDGKKTFEEIRKVFEDFFKDYNIDKTNKLAINPYNYHQEKTERCKTIPLRTMGIVEMSYLIENYDRKVVDSGKVVNQMLGSNFSSDLFQLIREKLGLAYSIESVNVDNYLFTIVSESETKNLDFIKEEVIKVVNQYQDLNYLKQKEAQFESMKELLIDKIKLSFDSGFSVFECLYHLYFKEFLETNRRCKQVESVSLNDICDFVNRLKLISVVKVVGEDNEKD